MSPRHPSRPRRVLRPLVRLTALAVPLAALPATASRAAEGDLAPASKPVAAGQARLLVVPFATLGDGTEPTAMRNALAETLRADLAPAGAEPFDPKGGGAPPDINAALAQARDRGAKYVVVGTLQSFGGELRVTGQVLDAPSGGTVGTLRATGPTSRFFAVQDAVVRQVAQAVGGPAPLQVGGGGESVSAPSTPRSARGGSYWAEYMDLYEPVSGSPSGYPASFAPPQPPIPPLYGGGNPNGLYGGGGGYYDGGYAFGGPVGTVPYPIQLGTVRTQYFGQLGTSIIPATPSVAQPAPIRTTFTATTGQTVYGTHTGAPITQYVNPWTRFASPGGQPQRAAPPNLRPGAASPAARAVASPAAKAR
jgi:TolB-like protein